MRVNALQRCVATAFLVVAVATAGPTLAGAQSDPATALLERDGWDALRGGRTQAAAQAFARALEHDPANPRLLLGAATAAALDQRFDDARRSAARALEMDPRLNAARALLGQVLYRMHDLSGAIREYGALASAAPDDRAVAATLERWKREADLRDRMQQQIGNHFTVSFEGAPDASLAARAIEGLERAYWRVGAALSVYPVDPVPVVLYTTDQFRDITRSPSWAAGAFDGIIRIPVRGALSAEDELDRVLAHEFTHAVVRSLAPRGVPAWLNEGLAVAFERGDPQWARQQISEAGRMTPLARLNAGFGGLADDDARVAYASSAMAVQQLLDENGPYAVTNLLRDIGDGADFEAAFARRMQEPLAEFSRTLRVP